MRTSREIYEKYNIMPALQLHQLRVAAVGKLICDNVTKPINERDVILACLFHDMGNIIKSDLSVFPEFLEPEGLDYWQGVKDEFVNKYGSDHHAANSAIAREIGLPQSALELLDNIGFSKLETILASVSDEIKICEYADLRVGPHGVLPLEERLHEGRQRYLKRHPNEWVGRGVRSTTEQFQTLIRTARELERQIFEHASIRPEDITDASVAPLVEELQNYSVA